MLFLAPIVGAIIGGFIARAMFRKHFEKPAWCEMKAEQRIFDPRAGLWLLIART